MDKGSWWDIVHRVAKNQTRLRDHHSLTHAVLHSVCNNLGAHRQGRRVPFSPPLFFIDFDDGHSDQCEVIPHCSFDLYFSND